MLLELYACSSAMPSGFERGFGLDLLATANRRPDSIRAISTSAITVGGPLMLVSNVLGLIGRYPVFVPGKPWRGCRQRSQQVLQLPVMACRASWGCNARSSRLVGHPNFQCPDRTMHFQPQHTCAQVLQLMRLLALDHTEASPRRRRPAAPQTATCQTQIC